MNCEQIKAATMEQLEKRYQDLEDSGRYRERDPRDRDAQQDLNEMEAIDDEIDKRTMARISVEGSSTTGLLKKEAKYMLDILNWAGKDRPRCEIRAKQLIAVKVELDRRRQRASTDPTHNEPDELFL